MIPPNRSEISDDVNSRKKWPIRSIGWVFFLGLCLGIGAVWSRYFIFTDGAIYAALGKSLAERGELKYCGGVHLFYPPGYPIAIAVFYEILRDAELSAHLVSLFAYLGSIVLTASFAWRLKPSPVFTWLSASAVAFHPYFVLYSSFALSESLFAFTILASAWCAWRLAVESKTPYWLWCLWGFLGGFAYLIRADGILYWPLQAIFILVLQRASLRIAGARCFLAVVVFAAVMFPYWQLIHQETGKWQLSTKTAILLEFSRMKMLDGSPRGETRQTSQLSEDGKTFAIDRAQDTLGSFLLHQPREAIARVVWNGSRLWKRNDIVFSWLTIPALAAAAAILKRKIVSRTTAFLILQVAPIIVFLIFYVEDRFLLAFIPFFAFLFARVGEWGIEQIRTYVGIRKALWIGVPLCLMAAGGLIAGKGTEMRRTAQRIFPSNLPIEHKQMGEWMRDNLPITATTRISHRNPWVSFYAEGCHARTPDFDIQLPEEERTKRLVEWCREKGVEYVVVDERMTLPSMPGLVYLLDENKTHASLQWLHTITGKSPKIVLYSIIPNPQQ